jgi:hypothetical protein
MNATLLNISSAVIAAAAPGKLLIEQRWKQTADGQQLAPANRYRAIELPADIWMAPITAMGNGTASQQFQLFVHDAIADLAKSYLKSICEESNMARVQVPQESFALDAWNAERAAISGRLNGDEIKAWLKQSATVASVATAHGDKVADAFGAQLVKLASPNHGLTADKADKLLTNLWQAADVDTTTGLRVYLKLQAIRDKVATTEANVLDSIL